MWNIISCALFKYTKYSVIEYLTSILNSVDEKG